METTVNLIPADSSRFTTDFGDWTAVSSTIARSTDVVDPNTGYPTLKLFTASGVAQTLFRTNAIHIYDGETVPWPLRATSRFKLSTAGQVVVYLTTVEGSASSTVSASAVVEADEWTLVSVDTEPISEQTSLIEYGIYVTNTSSSSPAYIGYPIVISPWSVIYNAMAREVWIRLPEYLRNADINRTEIDRPLLRFIDVLMFVAGQVFSTWENFRWIPPEDNGGQYKYSELVSPDFVPTDQYEVLQWLIQIVGAEVFNPSTGFTPWENFPTYDHDSNSETSPQTIWDVFDEETSGFVSPLDIAPDDGEVSWSEIETYAPAVSNLDGFLRWQANSAAYGFRAGTKESIIAAAQQALNGTQSVTFVPHYNNDVWHIALYIDPDEGDTGEVEEAVTPALPAGFQLTVFSS